MIESDGLIKIGGSLTGLWLPHSFIIGKGRALPILNFDYTTASLPSQLSFSRASNGTYFGVDGTLKPATLDTPRLDYDPSTHTAKGLLLEPQRVNYFYPSVPTVSGWAQAYNCNFTSAGDIGPDGSASIRVTQTKVNGPRAVMPAMAWDGSQGTTLTVYVKKGTARYLQLGSQVDLSSYCANYDLIAETSAIISGKGSVLSASTITNIGNGYYRLTATFATTSARMSYFFFIGFANDLTTARNATYTGTAGLDFVINMVQLEGGLTSTSYIKTMSAMTTRAADSLSATLPASGTIYREYQLSGATSVTKEIVDVSSGLLPSSFSGWLKTIKVWNRPLTSTEKSELLA